MWYDPQHAVSIQPDMSAFSRNQYDPHIENYQSPEWERNLETWIWGSDTADWLTSSQGMDAMDVARPYVPVAAGLLLAPFTGGSSLGLAAAGARSSRVNG